MEQTTTRLTALPAGALVARFIWDGNFAVALAEVDADTHVQDIGTAALGTMEDVAMLPEVAPLAHGLLVHGVRAMTVVPVPRDLPEYRLQVVEDHDCVGVVPLDDPMIGVLSDVDGEVHLRTVDIDSRAQTADYPLGISPPVSHDWLHPNALVTALRLESKDVVLAWVSEPGTGIQVMRLSPNLSISDGPVSVVTNSPTTLHTPKLVELDAGRVGMAWTGDSGLEVRFTMLPSELSQVSPTKGIVVNAETEGSQEYPELARLPDGSGALVAWGLESGYGVPSARIVRSTEPPTLEPSDADLAIDGGCARYSEPAAVVATSVGVYAAWYECGWAGDCATIVRKLELP